MLQSNNVSSLLESMNLEDIDSIRDCMSQYVNYIQENYGTTEYIISRSMADFINKSLDYRNDNYDQNIAQVLMTKDFVTRNDLTEPLYYIGNKLSGDNNLLSNSQSIKLNQCPSDYLLCKLYSKGIISDKDMDHCKTSLEQTMYSLIGDLTSINDNGWMLNVPRKTQVLSHEPVHYSYEQIEHLFNESWTFLRDNDIESLSCYHCTRTAITDKLYILGTSEDAFTTSDSSLPTQRLMNRQMTILMQWLFDTLEKLIQSEDLFNGLFSFAKKLNFILKQYPCLTLSMFCKLIDVCLSYSAFYYPGSQSRMFKLLNQAKSVMNCTKEYSVFGCSNEGEQCRNNLNFTRAFEYICKEFRVSTEDKDLNVTSYMESFVKDSELLSMNDLLTEMFQVASDGTIKVTINKKSTYMDEYAENHRLLKYNEKQHDYEAMEYNLVYHMILVDSIEKNVMHNPKVAKDSELYRDAMEARQYAQSDISHYLPIVRRNVGSFNINDFYKKVKADKATVQIHAPDTIRGIKSIIKSIIV